MRNRWFWLVNLALLLLYGWTLTEEASVRVRVADGMCTAVFPERPDLIRTSSIPCPGVQGGFVGLYFDNSANAHSLDWGPLDWLTPRAGWRTVTFSELRENGRRLHIAVTEAVPGWRRLWGEWRPVWETAVMRWQTPIYGDYLVETSLRRPSEAAGILILDGSGQNGWAFITSPNGRRGVWWAWQDGQPGEPIVGIPFQKSWLAQTQSLLRRALRAHQGALLLLLAGWLLAQVFGCGLTRMNTDFLLSLRSSRPLRFVTQPKVFVPLIALLTLAVTVYIAGNVLERIPHVQDSITYLFQAQTLAHGKLWANTPPLSDFFEHEFLIMRNGRWFGQYPPGFPTVLAVGVLLKQPWLVNPILAALTMPLLYLLGKALYGRSTALIAITLALFSPFFLFMSGSMMAHSAELFWLTLFMLGWMYALRRGGRRWPLLAGWGLGLTFLTRQTTAVTAGLPFLVLMLSGQWRETKRWRPLLVKLGWLLLTAVPLAALLFLYQNALTGSPFRDLRLLARPFDRPGFGVAIGESPNAFTLDQVGATVAVDWFNDPAQPPRGHTLARGIYNTEQNWRALEIELFGWLPLFTLAFVWLAFLGRRPSPADLALLAVLSGTVLIYIFYWADGIMYGPRYYYGTLPALFLLTARGMQASARRIGHGGKTAVSLLVAALIIGNLAFYLPYAVENHRRYNFVSGQDRAQVEKEIEGQALIFVKNDPANWWEYGRFFSGNSPWLDGRIIYVRDLGDEMNGRLLPTFPNYQPYRWQDGQLTTIND